MVLEFTSPAQVIFGDGAVRQAGKIASKFGRRAVVVTGSGGAALDRLWEPLADAGIQWDRYEVQGEPSIETVEAGISAATAFGVDLVIGCGGGSVLDTAKAISAMLTNTGELLDYLEVVGRGEPIRQPALPCIAIPTTAGTGSEVTRNAVLSVPEQRMKVSMRSPLMLPRVALVDPEFTWSLPPAVTASTGMDAITQVLEPYVSIRSNAMTDLFCKDGLQKGGHALRRAYHSGEDREARSQMAWTSLMGGMALANAGLGAVHGFASPIGGMFDAPHGAVCARLLSPVMAVNVRALRDRAPGSPFLDRYADASRWITGQDSARIEDGIAWLEELTEDLSIPGLSAYGLGRADVPGVVEKAAIASSMKANPIQLNNDELAEILEAAL